ncbi:hypothetical protein GB937_009826 [Aspergillus fischeri]|nr:hypothetical protein GB937_009826 [Aspergillus fischeri]
MGLFRPCHFPKVWVPCAVKTQDLSQSTEIVVPQARYLSSRGILKRAERGDKQRIRTFQLATDFEHADSMVIQGIQKRQRGARSLQLVTGQCKLPEQMVYRHDHKSRFCWSQKPKSCLLILHLYHQTALLIFIGTHSLDNAITAVDAVNHLINNAVENGHVVTTPAEEAEACEAKAKAMDALGRTISVVDWTLAKLRRNIASRHAVTGSWVTWL